MAMKIAVRTTSAAATRRLGELLARTLRAPAVLLLEGPLGSGKTTFVQGLVGALPFGAELRVQSPTFALARTYPTEPHVHHLDLYRLDEELAARDLGLLDQIAEEDAISCVEWPARAPSLLEHPDRLEVVFPKNASRTRTISFSGPLLLRDMALYDTLLEAQRQAAGRRGPPAAETKTNG
ncbi:MAG: tRNA (adenosine(37)-N6)-threonylcarbamoyltransferase complex ATPase subunit type 1 TsaE [Myxococcota bacterium]